MVKIILKIIFTIISSLSKFVNGIVEPRDVGFVKNIVNSVICIDFILVM